MKTLLTLIAIVLAVASAPAADKAGTNTFCVQLIRGTEENKPPGAGNKPIDDRLDKSLHRVFKTKTFWEVQRRTVVLQDSTKAQVALNGKRAVEIDLSVPGKRRVATFENGKLLSRAIRPAGQAMTVVGGDADEKNVWFIVVRRDVPP